jgi:RNA polymerase sigma-70 factor (ECF subfamily)
VTNWIPVVVHGEVGVRTEAVGKVPASVVVLSITNGRIRGVFQVLNPDKL